MESLTCGIVGNPLSIIRNECGMIGLAPVEAEIMRVPCPSVSRFKAKEKVRCDSITFKEEYV